MILHCMACLISYSQSFRCTYICTITSSRILKHKLHHPSTQSYTWYHIAYTCLTYVSMAHIIMGLIYPVDSIMWCLFYIIWGWWNCNVGRFNLVWCSGRPVHKTLVSFSCMWSKIISIVENLNKQEMFVKHWPPARSRWNTCLDTSSPYLVHDETKSFGSTPLPHPLDATAKI